MRPPPKATAVLSYSDWNDCIGRYCFTPRNAGKRVRLAIDPLVLQRAAAEGTRRHHFPTPESAAEDFRAAVARQIKDSGWDIGHTGRGAIPSGLAKLALQVLAVFGISADDEGGSSYWAALWGELGREVDKRGVKPEDLDLETHQKNWSALSHWANELNKGRLGKLPKPDPDAVGRRHVRLPLSHGLLRMEDIQGLHRLFSRLHLTPGEDVEPDELMDALRLYAHDPSVFRGAHARRVLQDERLPLAADQIASAAAQWDGQRVDLAKARGPVVRLWMSVHTAGAVRLRGGLLQLDPSGSSREVPGVSLADLLGRGSVRSQRTPIVYRPLADRLVVGVRSLLDGRFLEARHTNPGDDTVVARPTGIDHTPFERDLCRIAVGEKVTVSGKGTEGLPDGWCLYRLRVREGIQEADVPASLHGRVKVGGMRVRAGGGLRVRGAWMEGAGPSISVRGGDAPAVIVDGVEYSITDGCLHPERCPALDQLGVHEAWLPGCHRDRVRFRVAVPKPAKFTSSTVEAGWSWNVPPEWPGRLVSAQDSARPCVRGPIIEGEWPPARVEPAFVPAERVAVRLAVALRAPAAVGGPAAIAALKSANENHPNLLVRQLARAVRPHAGAK